MTARNLEVVRRIVERFADQVPRDAKPCEIAAAVNLLAASGYLLALEMGGVTPAEIDFVSEAIHTAAASAVTVVQSRRLVGAATP